MLAKKTSWILLSFRFSYIWIRSPVFGLWSLSLRYIYLRQNDQSKRLPEQFYLFHCSCFIPTYHISNLLLCLAVVFLRSFFPNNLVGKFAIKWNSPEEVSCLSQWSVFQILVMLIVYSVFLSFYVRAVLFTWKSSHLFTLASYPAASKFIKILRTFFCVFTLNLLSLFYYLPTKPVSGNLKFGQFVLPKLLG